jgi:transposase InsO family protein
MTQVRALRTTISPAMGKPYPLDLLLRVHGVARSTFYDAQRPPEPGPRPPPGKRGPKTALSDADVVAAIRVLLADAEFSGEGHRKLRVRLKLRDIHVGKRRILRLMRLHDLLAPSHRARTGQARVHNGTIITEAPNQCWGGDFTEVMTTQDGKVAIFDLIDHCTDEILGVTVTTEATRWSALDCLHQAVQREFGGLGKDRARGVMLRVDHGSQFTARDYVREVRHLGLTLSYAFVGQPECNGVIERWHRTLKEQVLWCRTWTTADEVRQAVLAFVQRYNRNWLIQRHGHRSPSAVRATFSRMAA